MSKALAALTLAASLIFGGPALMADHGQHGNKDHGEHGNQGQHGNKHYESDEGWQKQGGYEYRTYQNGVPPGWSKGKKTGWGNCGMPPGQAKKYGCRTYVYQGRPYYYYYNDIGQIIVRRPVIAIHGSVDIVQ